jgi:hypothetical protein
MKHVDAAMRNTASKRREKIRKSGSVSRSIAAELLVESVASGCGKEMSEVRR